jgi:hypothetical protein
MRRASLLVALACGCTSHFPDQDVGQPVDASPVPEGSADAPADADAAVTRRYLYAAFNDGTIHVYDMDAAHAEVSSFATVAGVLDVRGVCAFAETGTLYFSHARPEGGYVVAVDMLRQTVLWTHAYQPSVDRLACAGAGAAKKLYVPTNEAFTDGTLVVVDATGGDELSRIPISPRTHDCVSNLAGTRVYIETKSSSTIDVVDTGSDSVVGQVGPFAGIGGPLTIDGKEKRLYGNFFGVNGFQVGDIPSGAVVATAAIPGQTAVANQLDQHGIALSPDETEVWVNDGIGNQSTVHVFDVTVTPPAPKHDVGVDFTNAHWITFSIAGDYAYVAGPKTAGKPTDVIRGYQGVGTIGPSEDLLEVDVTGGVVTRVGSQFGVGRVSQ